GLEDGARRPTGDHAGAGGGGLEQDAAGAVLAEDRVRDRRPRQRDGEHALLGLLDALLDRGGHLLGLAIAEPHPSVSVADHAHRREREPPAALDHLGDPVDGDDPLFVLRLGHYSSSPASRAASATAATRPW